VGTLTSNARLRRRFTRAHTQSQVGQSESIRSAKAFMATEVDL